MTQVKNTTNANLTAGEIFPSGEIIERLGGGQLLLWTAEGAPVIGSSVILADQVYSSVPLDPGLEQALQFPTHSAPFGTTNELVQDLAEELDGDEVTRFSLATLILATWMADSLPTPPLLNVWGEPGTEHALVSILSCLCRRPLPIALPALGELYSLPPGLNPTLILRVKRDRDVASLLAVTAHSGAGSLKKGRLLQLRCPLIACTPAPLQWPALSVPLLPSTSCRPIGRAAAERMATCFQPRLLDFRLRRRQQVAASEFDVADFACETRTLAMTLGSVFEGEPELQARLVEALRPADESWKTLHAQADAAIVLGALRWHAMNIA